MKLVTRLLGAQNGWGGALGLLLLLGGGLVFLAIGVMGLNEAARVAPVELECATVAAATSPPKWVRVVRCARDGLQLAPGLTLKPRGVEATGDAFTGMLEGEVGARVLHEGKAPQRGKTLVPLVLGLIAIALSVRTVFMRWLVERDASL